MSDYLDIRLAEVYNQGWIAYDSRRRLLDCPFKTDPRAARWKQGFRDARSSYPKRKNLRMSSAERALWRKIKREQRETDNSPSVREALQKHENRIPRHRRRS